MFQALDARRTNSILEHGQSEVTEETLRSLELNPNLEAFVSVFLLFCSQHDFSSQQRYHRFDVRVFPGLLFDLLALCRIDPYLLGLLTYMPNPVNMILHIGFLFCAICDDCLLSLNVTEVHAKCSS